MTYQQIQGRIVSRFWSEGLKAEIKRRGYVFPAEDLLAAVYHQIPDFEERQALFRLIAEHIPEAAEHAKQILAWERKRLADFRVLGPDEIYELRITDKPGEDWMDFLCTDFDGCFDLIDRYYERFDWLAETADSRYSIEKRKIFTSGKTMEEDELGSCDLLPGKRIERVWYGDRSELPDCTGACCECRQDCIQNQEPSYPNFLPDRSPVRYRLPNGTVHFGVTLEHMTTESLVYIIPLDGEMLTTRDYSQFCLGHDHEHIPVPDVDAAAREALPDDLRENYDAFLAFLEMGDRP